MILRFATVRDAEALAAIYAPIVESTMISFEVLAPDVDEMRARIGTHPANKRGSSPNRTARLPATRTPAHFAGASRTGSALK